MNYLRSPFASWPVVGAVLLGGGVAAFGCQSILGIHDVSPDPTGTGGASGASTSAGPGTGGGATTSTGGQSAGFAFAVTDTSAHVPYGGFNYVNVEIIPSTGFSGAVDVTVQGAPTGLVVMPLTIPAGATKGKLEVGAGTTLTLGTMFTLTVVATSGSISKMATVPAVVTGKPGDLDQTFNSGIVAGPSYNGWVDLTDIRELATGNVLVSGVAVSKLSGGAGVAARYLPNGMLDTTFATTGILTLGYGHGVPTGFVSLARELDGTLLFYGSNNAYVNPSYTPYNIYEFRYTPSGVLAQIQGDNGIDVINLNGGNETVTAGALVPNSTDSIVTGAQDGKLFVARITDRYSNVVTTFAAPKGFIVPTLGGTASTAGALTIDAMGRIVVTGWVTNAATGDDVVLLRLTADGALDPSFGTAGVVTLARPGDQHGSSVIVQADGTILVAAGTTEGTAPQLLVQRFLASGAVDTTFGTQGAVLAPLGTNTNNADASGRTAWMVTMLDGRLVVAGNGNLGSTTGVVLARFLPDGSPDPTFGTKGELAVFVGMYGALGAMTLASDGKLLLAGNNSPNPPGASFVARLWN